MQKINENRVSKILNKLSGKPDQLKQYLFFYSVYTFVEGESFQTLDESKAEDKLKLFPEAEIYYCRLKGSPDNTPSILKGKRIKKEIVSGHEGLSELILIKTGVKIPDSDLMVHQTNMADLRPLNIRVKEFINKYTK